LYSYTVKSSEQWIVFSASKRINDRLLVGVSPIIGIRSLTYVLNEEAVYSYKKNHNGIVNNSSFINNSNASLLNYKLIFKFSASMKIDDKNQLGLTISTPSFLIYNHARNYRKIEQTNIDDLIQDDELEEEYSDFNVSNYSDDLSGHYKTPFSFAIGYDKKFSKEQISVSLEYTHAIQPYNLINGGNKNEELINSSNPEYDINSFLDVVFGQRNIVNFYVGYENTISEKVLLMMGFRTNYSATKNVDYSKKENALSIVDITLNQYHVSGGVTFTLFKSKFILGSDLGFTYDKDNYNLINYSNPLIVNDNGIPLRGNNEPTMNQFTFSIGFVFGYSFVF